MKKAVMMVAAVLFVVVGFASLASADTCEYYQWKRHFCKKEVKAAPAPAPRVEKIEKGEKVVLEGVYFDTGSAKIKKESFPVLDKNVEKIKNSKADIKIVIVGYTDDRGSDPMNQKLSESRAASVKKFMLSKGIDDGRIASMGKGKANPVADNKTEDGRAKNRRIEMEAK